MKNKKIYIYIVILIVVLLGITLTVKFIKNPDRQEIKEVNQINQQAGPMQIEEEYLGPNQNTPITPIPNE